MKLRRFFLACICMACLLTASAVSADQAQDILDATGVQGGLVVHLGCGDGTLTAALRSNDSFFVHGLDSDADNIAKARKHIHSLGAYGPVSVEHWDEDYLPYADNLVNMLVAENLGSIPMSEVMRVLAPHGAAYINQEGAWTTINKPWPDEIDEWSHFLHDAGNNA